jgi:hypothetical protein
MSYSFSASQMGTQSLGRLTLGADGNFLPGQAMAAYFDGTIAINMNIDWSLASTVACLADGTSRRSIDLAAAEAGRVGTASMSASQFMDLTILHELAHSFGLDHPGTNDANDVAGFNKGIWELCFK